MSILLSPIILILKFMVQDTLLIIFLVHLSPEESRMNSDWIVARRPILIIEEQKSSAHLFLFDRIADLFIRTHDNNNPKILRALAFLGNGIHDQPLDVAK
jgi:hypothetical protein